MEHSLALQLSHVTEIAATEAARTAGKGDKHLADQKATEAMEDVFSEIEFNGEVLIGEGERDEAPMLHIGEKLGTGEGKKVDIAVDPLENTNSTANLDSRAISVLAAAEEGGLFKAPDMYMKKLVVPPEASGKVSLEDPPNKIIQTIAEALRREPQDLVIVVLNRDRHEDLIRQIRKTGARIRLISDGDLIPGIATCMRGSGIHGLMGIGGSAEGVMTAAALRCIKGEMQIKFHPKNQKEKKRLEEMGGETNKIYRHDEIASGEEIIFCASGVTDGDLLEGVRFFDGGARTNTLVMSNQTEKVRFIDTTHVFDKDKVKYRF